MTVSLETPSGIERTLSGSQAAKALLKRAERRKIDFIFCCNVVMKTATIENYDTKRCMKQYDPQKRNPHYIVYTTAKQMSKDFLRNSRWCHGGYQKGRISFGELTSFSSRSNTVVGDRTLQIHENITICRSEEKIEKRQKLVSKLRNFTSKRKKQ